MVVQPAYFAVAQLLRKSQERWLTERRRVDAIRKDDRLRFDQWIEVLPTEPVVAVEYAIGD